jgi:hypothetical protein
MRCIRACARVAVHFHPDRFGFKPATVAESLPSANATYQAGDSYMHSLPLPI